MIRPIDRMDPEGNIAPDPAGETNLSKYTYTYEGRTYTVTRVGVVGILYVTHPSSISESIVRLTGDPLTPWAVKRYGVNATSETFKFIEDAMKAACKAVYTPDPDGLASQMDSFLETRCVAIV